MKRFTRTAMAGLLGLGCETAPTGVEDLLRVGVVDVFPAIASISVGSSLQLSATPKTVSGITVGGRAISWTSSDPSLATVSAEGLVQAVKVGGPVEIHASADGVVGQAVLQIRPLPITRVTVAPTQPRVEVGQSLQLSATAYDAADQPVPEAFIQWSSSATSVADVTTSGILLGVSEGGPVTITASAEGVTGTAAATVFKSKATRLSFVQQPSPASAGQTISPPVRVAIQDDQGRTMTGSSATVTIALGNNPGGATLTGTLSAQAVSGIATFGNLAVSRPGSGYTLVASSSGLATATSASFDVAAAQTTPPGPARLTITVQPSAIAARGVAFLQQPVIQVRDEAGNPVSQGGIEVTASIQSGPGNATLGGTTRIKTNGSGTASYTNLSIDRHGTFTLRFSAGGLEPATSTPITIP